MSVNVLGKKFELPNALAAMAISCAALIMSVGMGGCETLNGNSYGYSPAKYNRTNFRAPGVESGGMGKTFGIDKEYGGVGGVVSGNNNWDRDAKEATNEANKKLRRTSEKYQEKVGGK